MNQDAAPPLPTALSVSDRKSEFVPVSGGQETTSAVGLLLTAYVLMWAVVFGFVWLTAGKQKRLDARLRHVEKALARLDETSSEP